MTDDGAVTVRMSALFDPEPETWGLRGDPHLWRALRAHLADTDIPPTADELISLLQAAFRELAGADLTADTGSSVYLEQYDHGGMSGGMISLDTWRKRLMPMLTERGSALLVSDPVVVRRVDAAQAGDAGFTGQAAALLRRLVAGGAALGWVDPPEHGEVAGLLRDVATASEHGDAFLAAAWAGDGLAGLGYWRRYARPTHRPHADIEKVAIASACQGRGIGRLLMAALVSSAVHAGIEVLTLDFRGDNERAARLYRSLGFTEYGRLARFVAVGRARYDKVFYARDLRRPRPRHPESES